MDEGISSGKASDTPDGGFNTNIGGGFADAPRDAARAFRAIMGVLARPGEIATLGGIEAPAPLSVAAAVAVLTLCDPDTPLFLAASADTPGSRGWIAFHTGAPLSVPERAMFALGSWDELRNLALPLGSAEYPDRSATLIVETRTLSGTGATLRGPGIAREAALSLPEVAAFRANAALFPRGLDYFFTCGDRIAALPRTTKVS